jgi:threonine dehydrogenase-like Zn-dependent dehydrogenase
VLHAPHKIGVEMRPKPIIVEPTDAVVKVIVAGICGSELHPYRGHQKTTFGHIMVMEHNPLFCIAGIHNLKLAGP